MSESLADIARDIEKRRPNTLPKSLSVVRNPLRTSEDDFYIGLNFIEECRAINDDIAESILCWAMTKALADDACMPVFYAPSGLGFENTTRFGRRTFEEGNRLSQLIESFRAAFPLPEGK